MTTSGPGVNVTVQYPDAKKAPITIRAQLSVGSTPSSPVLKVQDLLAQLDQKFAGLPGTVGLVAPNGSMTSVPVSENTLLDSGANLINPTDGPIRDVGIGGTVILKPIIRVVIKNALWVDGNVNAITMKLDYLVGTQPDTFQDMVDYITANAPTPFDLNSVPDDDIGLQILNGALADPEAAITAGSYVLVRVYRYKVSVPESKNQVISRNFLTKQDASALAALYTAPSVPNTLLGLFLATNGLSSSSPDSTIRAQKLTGVQDAGEYTILRIFLYTIRIPKGIKGVVLGSQLPPMDLNDTYWSIGQATPASLLSDIDGKSQTTDDAYDIGTNPYGGYLIYPEGVDAMTSADYSHITTVPPGSYKLVQGIKIVIKYPKTTSGSITADSQTLYLTVPPDTLVYDILQDTQIQQLNEVIGYGTLNVAVLEAGTGSSFTRPGTIAPVTMTAIASSLTIASGFQTINYYLEPVTKVQFEISHQDSKESFNPRFPSTETPAHLATLAQRFFGLSLSSTTNYELYDPLHLENIYNSTSAFTGDEPTKMTLDEEMRVSLNSAAQWLPRYHTVEQVNAQLTIQDAPTLTTALGTELDGYFLYTSGALMPFMPWEVIGDIMSVDDALETNVDGLATVVLRLQDGTEYPIGQQSLNHTAKQYVRWGKHVFSSTQMPTISPDYVAAQLANENASPTRIVISDDMPIGLYTDNNMYLSPLALPATGSTSVQQAGALLTHVVFLSPSQQIGIAAPATFLNVQDLDVMVPTDFVGQDVIAVALNYWVSAVPAGSAQNYALYLSADPAKRTVNPSARVDDLHALTPTDTPLHFQMFAAQLIRPTVTLNNASFTLIPLPETLRIDDFLDFVASPLGLNLQGLLVEIIDNSVMPSDILQKYKVEALSSGDYPTVSFGLQNMTACTVVVNSATRVTFVRDMSTNATLAAVASMYRNVEGLNESVEIQLMVKGQAAPLSLSTRVSDYDRDRQVNDSTKIDPTKIAGSAIPSRIVEFDEKDTVVMQSITAHNLFDLSTTTLQVPVKSTARDVAYFIALKFGLTQTRGLNLSNNTAEFKIGLYGGQSFYLPTDIIPTVSGLVFQLVESTTTKQLGLMTAKYADGSSKSQLILLGQSLAVGGTGLFDSRFETVSATLGGTAFTSAQLASPASNFALASNVTVFVAESASIVVRVAINGAAAEDIDGLSPRSTIADLLDALDVKSSVTVKESKVGGMTAAADGSDLIVSFSQPFSFTITSSVGGGGGGGSSTTVTVEVGTESKPIAGMIDGKSTAADLVEAARKEFKSLDSLKAYEALLVQASGSPGPALKSSDLLDLSSSSTKIFMIREISGTAADLTQAAIFLGLVAAVVWVVKG